MSTPKPDTLSPLANSNGELHCRHYLTEAITTQPTDYRGTLIH